MTHSIIQHGVVRISTENDTLGLSVDVNTDTGVACISRGDLRLGSVLDIDRIKGLRLLLTHAVAVLSTHTPVVQEDHHHD